MGVSFGGHIDGEGSEVPLINEKRETSQGVIMDMQHHGIEIDFEFWPVEHPVEPSGEDHPVKCPMPDSSVINLQGGEIDEERYAESSRKRGEQAAAIAMKNERKTTLATQPSARAVRKRHHTLTNGDHRKSFESMQTVPLPTQNTTAFEMIQQSDKSKS